MRTIHRIENDLALLDDADAQNLRMTAIELLWSDYPQVQRHFLLQGDGAPRLWGDDALHEAFSREMRALIRNYLMKDKAHCCGELTKLGVEIDEN